MPNERETHSESDRLSRLVVANDMDIGRCDELKSQLELLKINVHFKFYLIIVRTPEHSERFSPIKQTFEQIERTNEKQYYEQ